MSRSGYYGVNDKDLAKKILKLNNNKKKIRYWVKMQKILLLIILVLKTTLTF